MLILLVILIVLATMLIASFVIKARSEDLWEEIERKKSYAFAVCFLCEFIGIMVLLVVLT